MSNPTTTGPILPQPSQSTPYSSYPPQAVRAGDTVYLSGQTPLDPETMELVSSDVREQIDQVFRNLRAVARAAGGDFRDLVKLNVYLTDLADFPLVNEVMAGYFDEPYPARAAIGVASLPKGGESGDGGSAGHGEVNQPASMQPVPPILRWLRRFSSQSLYAAGTLDTGAADSASATEDTASARVHPTFATSPNSSNLIAIAQGETPNRSWNGLINVELKLPVVARYMETFLRVRNLNRASRRFAPPIAKAVSSLRTNGTTKNVLLKPGMTKSLGIVKADANRLASLSFFGSRARF